VFSTGKNGSLLKKILLDLMADTAFGKLKKPCDLMQEGAPLWRGSAPASVPGLILSLACLGETRRFHKVANL